MRPSSFCKYSGFILPTVVVVSLVMLSMLVVTLQVIAASSDSLRTQYYQQLAREAAEAGVAKAQACLENNNYVASWTEAATLRPNTNCNGSVLSGASANLLSLGNIRTSYVVNRPITSNGVQYLRVDGSVETVASGSSTATKSYSYSAAAVAGGQISFNRVTFGYSVEGAFFGTIYPDGKVTTLGFNGYGQLGNGTTANSAFPTSFNMLVGVGGTAMYTNFLSRGQTLFVTGTDGNLYGAGRNDYGQLGGGTVSANQSIPLRFRLPSGVSPRFVATNSIITYVLGSNNSIYAAGACKDGMLGSNYTIANCSNASSPVRVSLPTPTSDPATIPVPDGGWEQATNLTTDAESVFVRMQGGQVYGWGSNNRGQLATGDTVSSSSPVRIGSFGDSGQPKAVQIAFDGITVYILDSNGDVYTAGANFHGQLAGAPAPILGSTDMCWDDPAASTTSGVRLRLWTCNNTAAQDYEWSPDGMIRVRPSGSAVLCVENSGGSSADKNPILLMNCNTSSAAQKWTLWADGSIRNPATGKCIDNPGNSSTRGIELQIYNCNNTAAQIWTLPHQPILRKVPVPSSAGKVTRITTDQWSVLFLTTSGQVWGAGENNLGQLGNGQTTTGPSPKLTQMTLPSGRKATYVYNTRASYASSEVIANTYVVLDNGRVYGTGDNRFGQLGVGNTTNRSTPVEMQLPTGERASTVQSGIGTTVVLSVSGYIYTVGNNQHGQLGSGTAGGYSSLPRLNRYTNASPPVVY